MRIYYISTHGDGEAAAGLLRSVQLLQKVRAGGGKDPAAPHRLETGQSQGDGGGRMDAAARTALGAAALLAHPQQDQELAVMVDASADHVGAALQQRRSAAADWQPLAFFSKKLEPAQMRDSAFDRELFTCVAGIRHFRYMLEGRPFTIYTAHKPLTFALGKVSEPWTAMQSRQLSYVAEFTTDIRHIPGSENIVADTLSRPPPAALPTAATGGPAVAASPVSLDYARIAANQKTCQETLKAAHSSSLQLQHVDMQGERVVCDTSTGQPRPLIPAADRRNVFRAIHELAHTGIRATRRLMAARVVWRGMASDVAAWCRDCQLCARGKASPQHTAPVQPIPVPKRRFTHVHVDLVGPLPASTEGFKYLFTMVDRSSRWLEAVPLKSMAAEDCVDVLISAWVARFGYHPSSRRTKAASSPPPSGRASPSCWGSSTCRPPPTTHSPMGW